MKISVSLSEQDVKDYLALKLNSNSKARTRRVTLLVAFFILVSLIFWLESKSISQVVIYDILVGFIIRFGWRRFIRRAYKRNNLMRTRTIELKSDSIVVSSDGVRTLIESDQVQDIHKTGKLVIISLHNSHEIVIPMRYFNDQSEYTEFVEKVTLLGK